jgi:hypothetical protein
MYGILHHIYVPTVNKYDVYIDLSSMMSLMPYQNPRPYTAYMMPNIMPPGTQNTMYTFHSFVLHMIMVYGIVRMQSRLFLK